MALSGKDRPRKGRPAKSDADRPPPNGELVAAREAVENFLYSQFQARALRIIKIAALPNGNVGWYAEAEMLVPDLAIKTLGLPLSQEILEREHCAVELDAALTVKSYEVLDLNDR